MDDHERTDEDLSPEELAAELAEAEALARALERGHGAPELPDDALEAAALLRYSAGADDLDEGRMRSILDDVFAEARATEVTPGVAATERKTAPGFAWLKWLFPLGGLAAAAAAGLLFVTLQQAAPPEGAAGAEVATATVLPAPTAALLQAQARAASPGAEGRLALASAMGDYRGSVLGSLTERYGR